ncbi:MAG: hypothetical protein ACPGGC_05410 [Porticoccaceae bacterium]
MNIGLIILLTSLFVGAEDNNDQPAEIKKPNSERITKNEDVKPILFKGNNPYSGEFNGNTYWKGYIQ